MKSPKSPSQAEIDEHNVSHCPFRSWCKWCVFGQSVAKGHFKKKESESENEVPTVSLYYMFMKERQEENEEDEGEEGQRSMPTMVMLDHESDMMFSSIVPKKGVNP